MLVLGVSTVLDRSAAWVLRTLRSLGYGAGGTTAVMLALVVPLAVVSAALARIAKPLVLVPLVLMLIVLHRMIGLANRLGRAIAAGEVDEATRLRRLIDGEGPPRNRVEKNVRLVGQAEALLADEKWAEARDLFATIEVDVVHAIARPGIVSELGYATAHAGQPAEGVEHLLRAVRMAEAHRKYPRARRWYLDQRLGVALSLAGRHDEAITVLDPLTSDGGGEPRPWTEALYFMAQSSAALGMADASLELLSVAAAQGEGPFRTRARAALELATSAPHRVATTGPIRLPASEASEASEEDNESEDAAEARIRLSKGRVR